MGRSLRRSHALAYLIGFVAWMCACSAYDRNRYRDLTDAADRPSIDGTIPRDGSATDATADAPNDPCARCTPNETCCDAHCVSLDEDPFNCGACGQSCVHTTCSGASCTNLCLVGFDNCNANVIDGCETALTDDAMHCGRCGHVCSGEHATERCASGSCAVASCTAGFADCDQNATNGCEVDLTRDVTNCGTCGTTCPAANHATASCTASRCGLTCAPGFADCDGVAANGCEASLGDAAHCGACGVVCGGASPVCSSRGGSYSCTGSCDATQTMCGSSCVDTANDANNCGACGNVCPRPAGGDAACVAGTCRSSCPSGRTQCGTACVDAAVDVNNCGACGTACPRPQSGISTCTGGMCGLSCNAGFHACGSSCVDNTSLATCGAHCAPCLVPANATATCNGVGCGYVCNAGFGDCDSDPSNGCEAVVGGACVTDGVGCVVGTRACRSGGVECVSPVNAPAGTACGTDRLCDAAGVCHDSLVTGFVHCNTGALTADQVCQGLGFAGATFARGFGWFQCAGTLERCPGGWGGDGTQCLDWCAGTDCVGVPFCGAGPTVTELSGDGATFFDPSAVGGCGGGNPGWTVRLRCHY